MSNTRTLRPSRSLKDATGEYQNDLDPLRDWLTDNTVEMPAAWASFKGLYADYQTWARENGLRIPMGSKRFSQGLEQRFKPHRGAKGIRGFGGVGLKAGAQLRGDTSQVSPIAEPLLDSQNESHARGVIQTQIGGDTSEVSPTISAGASGCSVCGEQVQNGAVKVYLADGGIRHDACRTPGP